MGITRDKVTLPQKNRVIGLQLKVSFLILLPMFIILILSSLIAYSRQRNKALANMSLLASQTGQVIERALQRDMLLSDFDRIQATFDEIGKDDRIRTLYLIDITGNVIFAPSGGDTGTHLNNNAESCQPCHGLSASKRPSGVVVTGHGGQSVFRSMQPIENLPECNQCHDPKQKFIGFLLTDLSIEPIESALAVDVRNNLVWWIGTVVLTAVLANLAVNRWVISRLRRFTLAIEDFGRNGISGKLPEEPADEIGRLSAAFNAMAQQVEKREEENNALSEALRERADEKSYLLKRIISTQETERQRVAHELHDDLGQSLSTSALNIEIAQRKFDGDPRAAAKHLQQARSLIAEATDRMYDLILGLRPSVLDDLGLIAALRLHCQRTLELTGITYDINIQGITERLPPEIETVLFRIFQEALTNILRHAKASHVLLWLIQKDSVVEGQIEDNGVGFDPEAFSDSAGKRRGLGLLGMRERAEQCNGQLEVISRFDQGTCIRVSIPIQEKTDGRNN